MLTSTTANIGRKIYKPNLTKKTKTGINGTYKRAETLKRVSGYITSKHTTN